MPPTILQEKALKPETLPWISSIFSALLIIAAITFSIIYTIDWWTPVFSTQVTSQPDICYPIRFKCAGCTQQSGCSLVVQGINTLNANKHLNLSTNYIINVPTDAIRTLNICAGDGESIMISFNYSAHIGALNYIGFCQPNRTISEYPSLVGYLEISPDQWSPLNTFFDVNYNTHIIEYAMWRTTLFSNGTTLRYQAGIVLPAPQYYCFPTVGHGFDKYFCTSIRMSMITWVVEETRSGFLTLIGIIGGLAGIFYRLSFWSLLLFRRVHSYFSPQSYQPSQNSQGLIQTELS